MVVLFEFLSYEPIENVITCMHYRVDKVVYFGQHDRIQERRKSTERFLKECCGVQRVVFHELSADDLPSMLRVMRDNMQHERSQGARVYYDVTGGEGLPLVAFGILSREFETPMHMYDVPADRLIEIEEGVRDSISQGAAPQEVQMDLDHYIALKGGVINWGLHKDIKERGDDAFAEDIARIWRVARQRIDYWNPFADLLRDHMVPDAQLRVDISGQSVRQALNASPNNLRQVSQVQAALNDLAAAGILQDLSLEGDRYRFRYKDESLMECLWEGGSILELYTYELQRRESDDCRVGVHLDWDGVIHQQAGEDVVNEVDVLSLSGNIPTFISCKSGKMRPQQTLHALYELDAVTRRFGGKYARKILVSARDIGDIYLERAAEMDIEVQRADG